MRRGRLTILKAEAIGFDLAARQVRLADGQQLPYDHLLVAAGATHSYFGHDDWAVHAPGLKTLADAFAIRARVIGAFESAEACTEPGARAPWMTFVVIGAGPTGVEMAGTLAEIARHTLPQEFRRIDSTQARVVLLEGSERVLGSFVPALSARAREQLAKLGVDVRTGAKVIGIDTDGVSYETRDGNMVQPHRLPAKTVIWAAGVAASPLGRALAAATGATLDRAGRVVVAPDLSLPGHPEIAVIGDLAAARSHARGQPAPAPGSDVGTPVPGVSPAAKQMGRAAAANLLRRLRGEPTQPFHYTDYGNLATIGRRRRPLGAGVRRAALLRLLRLAVLALRAHLVPDRLSEPLHRDDGLGLGLLDPRALGAGGGRATGSRDRRATGRPRPPPGGNLTTRLHRDA
jgi:NADH:ubiquinone reductase (H+-translocating)